MLGLGFGEIFVVAIVLLVAVGPKRLPTLMRAIGKALREFRRGAFELRQASGIDQMMNEDINALRKPLKEIRPSLEAITQEQPLEATATQIQGGYVDSSETPSTARDIEPSANSSLEEESKHLSSMPPEPTKVQGALEEGANVTPPKELHSRSGGAR